mmetsp:Transcript_560/g.1669  ORF Transcript_560/g.1669 Transcript_560/m.1669 type:complete len:852 (-) Transcript_560:470-3025(-)|eukprot:CAMPEP_0206142852 /NCGR_PEP_ID=MMETSP1473-20131121/18432_1 /ASSEMBLY_ACC=CAM_ASM_001109 /TAXON_ID=1461547 /ORGANISM="Stichococcus sp, Strain RCC1054" /LENGTH=851 /DNA_ID=CAMNT_0053538003 /DNA_START=230 /DNA_END=2785 /DNA_ORIENTATION=+
MAPTTVSSQNVAADASWQPDQKRVLIHLDVDCFYCQTEEIRDPSLRERPVAITQKYLCVTCNYPARQSGVKKLQSCKDALLACPELVLISGEDLTPYRRASRAILAVLTRFGILEKGGMDEAFLDVTKEARSRVAAGDVGHFQGHIHLNQGLLQSDNPHRPMDLRVSCLPAEAAAAEAAALSESMSDGGTGWGPLLCAGTAIAAEARAAVKAETGFRTSAGIACNKMLAKLVSGLHKPDDQTVLFPTEAAGFIRHLPLRAIHGVGYKMSHQLEEMQLRTADDLRKVSSGTLISAFGQRIGSFLFQAARGKDSAAIKPVQPPKAVTVEDSFKSCSTPNAAAHVLKILAPDLIARVQEEFEETGRRPTALLLKWRLFGSRWQDGVGRSSTSCPMPPVVQPPFGGEAQAHAIEKAAITLLTRNTIAPFNLTLLNLGASNFVGGCSGGIGSFLIKPAGTLLPAPLMAQKSWPTSEAYDTAAAAAAACAATTARRDYGAAPAGVPLSKQAERALREGARSGRPRLPFPPPDGPLTPCQPAAGRQPTAQLPTSSVGPAGVDVCRLTVPCRSQSSGDDAGGDSSDEWADIIQSRRLRTHETQQGWDSSGPTARLPALTIPSIGSNMNALDFGLPAPTSSPAAIRSVSRTEHLLKLSGAEHPNADLAQNGSGPERGDSARVITNAPSVSSTVRMFVPQEAADAMAAGCGVNPTECEIAPQATVDAVPESCGVSPTEREVPLQTTAGAVSEGCSTSPTELQSTPQTKPDAASDGCEVRPLEASGVSSTERAVTPQEAADWELAHRLQREEAAAEAQRRRDRRRAFMMAGTATSLKSGRRLPAAKRNGGPTLDSFVSKRRC